MFAVESSWRCSLVFDGSATGYVVVGAGCRGPGVIGGSISGIHIRGGLSECGCDVDRCVFDTPLLWLWG